MKYGYGYRFPNSRSSAVAPVALPLDNQPPFKCAYSSQRKLKSDYDGPCLSLRVQPFAEIDFGFNTSNQIDNDAIIDAFGAVNPTTKKIYDQTGNGNHATAYSDSTEATLVIGGYDGTINKFSNNPTPYYILDGIHMGSQYECIGLVKYHVLAQEFGFASGAAYTGYLHSDNASFFIYAAPLFWNFPFVYDLDTWVVMRTVRDGLTAKLYVNEVLIGQQTLSSGTSTPTFIRFPGETTAYTNYQSIEWYLADQILPDNSLALEIMDTFSIV